MRKIAVLLVLAVVAVGAWRIWAPRRSAQPTSPASPACDVAWHGTHRSSALQALGTGAARAAAPAAAVRFVPVAVGGSGGILLEIVADDRAPALAALYGADGLLIELFGPATEADGVVRPARAALAFQAREPAAAADVATRDEAGSHRVEVMKRQDGATLLRSSSPAPAPVIETTARFDAQGLISSRRLRQDGDQSVTDDLDRSRLEALPENARQKCAATTADTYLEAARYVRVERPIGLIVSAFEPLLSRPAPEDPSVAQREASLIERATGDAPEAALSALGELGEAPLSDGAAGALVLKFQRLAPGSGGADAWRLAALRLLGANDVATRPAVARFLAALREDPALGKAERDALGPP